MRLRLPTHAWPALILCLVATVQIALAQLGDLSPWLGGGFGMFAAIDSRSERHLAAVIETPGLRRPVRIPQELEDLALRTRVFPTEARLRNFADRLLSYEEERLGMSGRMTLELWRTRRHPETLAPRDVRVAEVIVSR